MSVSDDSDYFYEQCALNKQISEEFLGSMLNNHYETTQKFQDELNKTNLNKQQQTVRIFTPQEQILWEIENDRQFSETCYKCLDKLFNFNEQNKEKMDENLYIGCKFVPVIKFINFNKYAHLSCLIQEQNQQSPSQIAQTQKQTSNTSSEENKQAQGNMSGAWQANKNITPIPVKKINDSVQQLIDQFESPNLVILQQSKFYPFTVNKIIGLSDYVKHLKKNSDDIQFSPLCTQCKKCAINFDYNLKSIFDLETYHIQNLKRNYRDVILLNCCNNFCHLDCAEKSMTSFVFECQSCKKVSYLDVQNTYYNGVMSVTSDEKLQFLNLQCGTLVIEYQIPEKTVLDTYSRRTNLAWKAFNQKAYLPNTPDGLSVLKLLQKAFNQNYTFQVDRDKQLFYVIDHITSPYAQQYNNKNKNDQAQALAYMSRVKDQLSKIRSIQ